jgi:hypothetical protein
MGHKHLCEIRNLACGEGDTLTFHAKSPVYFTWKKENYILRWYYVEAAEVPRAEGAPPAIYFAVKT